MDNDPEKIIGKARNVKLSAGERNEIMSKFNAFMEAHPYEDKAVEPKLSPHSFFGRMLYSAMAFAAFFAAYVGFSEASLPGTPLHFFKTEVNESIVQSFTFTNEGKADVALMMLERRLDEAAHVGLDRGARAPEWERIKREVELAADEVAETVSELVLDGDPAAAASLVSEEAALLAAHEVILDNVIDLGASELEEVRDVVEKEKNRNATFAPTIATELAEMLDIKEEAEEVLDEAEKITQKAEALKNEEDTKGDKESVTLLDNAIDDANAVLKEGREILETGDHDAALLKFGESKKRIYESLEIVGAEDEFGIDIRIYQVGSTTPTSTVQTL